MFLLMTIGLFGLGPLFPAAVCLGATPEEVAGRAVTMAPVSVNVSVGERATFSCGFNYSPDHVVWFLDDDLLQLFVDLDAQEYLHLEPLPSVSTLRILISSKYKALLNNTFVSCLAISEDFSLFQQSSPATLTVQGVLEAPSSINAVFTENGVAVQWGRPYTLDGVKISGYIITIIIANQFSDNANVTNLPWEEYGRCHYYSICVQGKTAAGLGKELCTNTTISGALDPLHDHAVQAMVFNHPLATIDNHHQLQSSNSCHINEDTGSSVIELPVTEEYNFTNMSSLSNCVHSNVSLCFNLDMEEMASNDYITANVSISNETMDSSYSPSRFSDAIISMQVTHTQTYTGTTLMEVSSTPTSPMLNLPDSSACTVNIVLLFIDAVMVIALVFLFASCAYIWIRHRRQKRSQPLLISYKATDFPVKDEPAIAHVVEEGIGGMSPITPRELLSLSRERAVEISKSKWEIY